MPGPLEGSEQWAAPTLQSLRKCPEKGKCRCPAHKSMKQDQLRYNQGIQLRGPLPRKEVEYLRCQGDPSGVSRSLSNTPKVSQAPKVSDPRVMVGCPSIPLLPPALPHAQMPTAPHPQCICIHTPSYSSPPQQNNTSKEDWGVNADASAGPVLGAAQPLSQDSPASLKGGDCHSHFTEEEAKAEVGTQGKARSPLS